MVIRWISRLISERKRRKLRNELHHLSYTNLLLSKFAAEAIDEAVKYATLMKLYDESEPEYLLYKKQRDWMFERATEYQQERRRKLCKIANLLRQIDRLSK